LKQAGTYNASIIVSPTGGGDGIEIPVVYQVIPAVTASVENVTYSVGEGDLPLNQSVILTGISSSSFSLSVQYDSQAQDWLALILVPIDSATHQLSLRPVKALPVGNYQATAQIGYSANGVSNTVDIAVAYNVTPSITLSTNAINLSAIERETSEPQSFTINYAGSQNVDWQIAFSSADGINWASAVQNSGSSLPATIEMFGLPHGPVNQYSGELTINYSLNGIQNTLALPVTYDIAPRELIVDSPLTYSLDINSLPGDLSQTVSIGSNTSQNLDWNATADQSWVILSKTNGDTATDNQLTVTLDAAQLSALDRGNYTAAVTFSSSVSGVPDTELVVNVIHDSVHIQYLTPSFSYSNTTQEKILRGGGFSHITNQTLMLGSYPAVSMTVVSDNEIRFTPPALLPGKYPVSIDGNIGLSRSDTELSVIENHSFAGALFPSAGMISRVRFDAVTETIYAVDVSNDSINRYRYNGSTWDENILSVPGIADIALDPNGKEIVAIALRDLNSQLIHISTDTFMVDGTYDVNIGFVSDLDRIEIANNGKAYLFIGTSGYIYDIATHDVVQSVGARDAYKEAISQDRSRIIAMQRAVYPRVMYYYNASTDAVYDNELGRNTQQMFLSHDASKLVITSGFSFDIFDYNFNLLGTGGSSGDFGVLSNDGTRFFTYTSSIDSIYGYDISDPQNIIGLGSYSPLPFGEYLGRGFFQSIRPVLVTPDDKYILMAGDQNIVLTPIIDYLLP
jgi:hypothetical protein